LSIASKRKARLIRHPGWHSEKRHASQVESSVEDVPPCGNECAAELGLKKYFWAICNWPSALAGQPRTLAVLGRHGASGGRRKDTLLERETGLSLGVMALSVVSAISTVLLPAADAAYKPVSSASGSMTWRAHVFNVRERNASSAGGRISTETPCTAAVNETMAEEGVPLLAPVRSEPG